MANTATITELYSFLTTPLLNGYTPTGSLIIDGSGNLYGTTNGGGLYDNGLVYKLTNTNGSYSFSTLYVSGTPSSDARDLNPNGGLIADASGNLYGTTLYNLPNNGAGYGQGTVFKLTNNNFSYTKTQIYNFGANLTDGRNPYGSLIVDQQGNLYGLTQEGGAKSKGIAFELLNNAGQYTEKLLYTFGNASTDPAKPHGSLIKDSAGNLYGTTMEGGTYGKGTVFELINTNGTYTEQTLYSLGATATDGTTPRASLITDADGNLYGTTYDGGTKNYGTVFKLTKADTYRETVLYNFTNAEDGANPTGSLIADANGTLYGTTTSGGANGSGAYFALVKSGAGYSMRTLASATVGTGQNPSGDLVADASGTLYTTALNGGTGLSPGGTVVKLTNTGFAVPAPACFAPGTRIATPTGEIAIEHIAVGGLVRTASGAVRRVIWTGRRHVRLDRHARPWDVNPIRIRAHAFAPGRPARDLRLSPDHAVFDDRTGTRALFPARYLLNDLTITQEQVPAITWHHLELESHDIVLAEGLPCETYLDTGNRHAFENNGTLIMATPDFARTTWDARAYAPLVLEGCRLTALRAALHEEARRHAGLSTDPAFGVITEAGEVLRPVKSGQTLHYRLPAGTESVRLVSRAATPASVKPDSDDRRRIGIAVSHVEIDGCAASSHAFGEGWHEAEACHRATNGDAALYVSFARTLSLRLADIGMRYWLAA